MADVSFDGLVLVAAVALAAPLLANLVPSLRLPSAVLEIVLGIVVGPAVLGWVEADAAIRVFALVGLAFLLFLSGLEIDLTRLGGRTLRVATAAFAVSFGLALVAGAALSALGQADDALFAAIVLSATSLGVVVPLLKDAGETATRFGQLTIAAASIADFATIVLLTLFFSREATGTGTKLLLLGGFVVAGAAVVAGLAGLSRWRPLSAALLRLQDTTAQVRVRGAFLLLAGFAALAERLGLEVILGAFTAGAVLSLIDRDALMTHPHFRTKLEGAGFGFFVPVFFVSVGLAFDLDALTSSASTLLRVPLFLAAVLLVRGLPAIMYRGLVGGRGALVAGLLQATTLPFIVAASMIGVELGVIDDATSAALIGAGLLSVVLLPPFAAALLAGGRAGDASAGAAAATAAP